MNKDYSDYNFVPVYREIYADVITPITLLRRLAASYDDYYLLESVEGGINGPDISGKSTWC